MYLFIHSLWSLVSLLSYNVCHAMPGRCDAMPCHAMTIIIVFVEWLVFSNTILPCLVVYECLFLREICSDASYTDYTNRMLIIAFRASSISNRGAQHKMPLSVNCRQQKVLILVLNSVAVEMQRNI